MAAPTGRDPYVAVTITAETRPSISPGVTACRSVVVLIVQSSGPAPISAGAAYDLFHSYDPLFWAFVVLASIPVGAVLLARR